MKNTYGYFLGALVVLGALVYAAELGISRTVDYAVGADATQKALKWSTHLAHTIPDLEELIATGRVTSDQLHELEEASHIGDIFRFKLFDSEGSLVLISDELARNLEAGAQSDHNGNAAMVLQTGEPELSINDGTNKENRPPLYVEAYVPVKNAAGQPMGVVEVYLDQTGVSEIFHRSFHILTFATAFGLILTFGAPYLAFLIKMNQETRSRAKAEYFAKYDQVANILNRKSLMSQLGHWHRDGKINLQKSACIFADIDHFKAVNDTYGHKIGDAFIRHIAESISLSLKPNDLVGRIGGDEFLLVAQRETLDEVVELVEEIRMRISAPIRVDGSTISGHISAGIHYDPEQDFSLEDRMNKADVALYQAKLNGRDTYCIFSEQLEATISRRRRVEAAISTGLADGRFEVNYQPLLNQKTKRCVGFEALLRLRDFDDNTIAPNEFIPIAEAMGEINKLGQWVLRRAVFAAAEWPAGLFVSVNLSARQFDKSDLVSVIREALQESELEPHRLELEVTESILMENTDSIAQQLSAIKDLGVSLAMDDFGSGYSSLGYLWQFGFDKLKIDRSFISGLSHDQAKVREILDTIIMLGHRLEMTVTAEGVETESQARLLEELSCDHFQGFLYGKPMEPEDLAAFVMTNLGSELRAIENKTDKDESREKIAVA